MRIIKNTGFYTIELKGALINFHDYEVDKRGRVLMFRNDGFIGLMRGKHARKFCNFVGALS